VNISPTVTSSLVFETLETAGANIDVYLLTAGKGEGIGSVLSKQVLLNGRLMKMGGDTVMPQLVPVTLPSGQPVNIPPLSLAFLVFPDASVTVCMS